MTMQKVNNWITGIYLHNYETDRPDGTLLGFDADYGEMYALDGKLTDAYDYKRRKGLKPLQDIRPVEINKPQSTSI